MSDDIKNEMTMDGLARLILDMQNKIDTLSLDMQNKIDTLSLGMQTQNDALMDLRNQVSDQYDLQRSRDRAQTYRNDGDSNYRQRVLRPEINAGRRDLMLRSSFH